MNTVHAPWIKLKESLNHEDYDLINVLQEQCVRKEQVTLKLELDYKLGASLESAERAGIQDVNEFMYFDGRRLVGYIGICGFGRPEAPLEATGMVHPEYRRQGIFSILHQFVLAECQRRNSGGILVLCEKGSVSGQKFLEKLGAVYQYSEFEMYLQENSPGPSEERLRGVTLRKAANADAREIARQDAIYFCGRAQLPEPGSEESASAAFVEKDVPGEAVLLPEDEEKRGMTIYLAEKDDRVVGKVHLQISAAALGGIYGLGVLPEHRGNGFGRAILLGAVEKLKDAKAKAIMLQVAAENAKALNLYTSCGFRETSVMDYFRLNP